MVLHQWRNRNFQRIPIYIYEESSASMLYEGKTIYVSKSCSFSDVFFLQAMKPEYEWWKRISFIGTKVFVGMPVTGYQLHQIRDEEFSSVFSLSEPLAVWVEGLQELILAHRSELNHFNFRAKSSSIFRGLIVIVLLFLTPIIIK